MVLCKAITNANKQCTHYAMRNIQYCFQHQKRGKILICNKNTCKLIKKPIKTTKQQKDYKNQNYRVK